MNYRACYEEGRKLLEAAGIEEAALDARLLLEYVCHTNRNDLLVHADRTVSDEEEASYEALIRQRARRIPLQHLTGTQEFMGLEFKVNSDVLIPRQDTEILVEEVMRYLHDGARILDMCTGSGCILISLLHYSNDCRGVGADLSGPALEIAKTNAAALLDGKKDCSFVCSDLFENVTGIFDVIVSNPPYIRTDVIPTLMPEVKDHEPMGALDGREDGLYFYREIVQKSREHLQIGGMLFMEIGYDQAREVSELMEQAGYQAIEVIKDYAGQDRVVYGTY